MSDLTFILFYYCWLCGTAKGTTGSDFLCHWQSLVFCLQRHRALLLEPLQISTSHLWCILAGGVWFWTKSNLFQSIESQTHFSTCWHVKRRMLNLLPPSPSTNFFGGGRFGQGQPPRKKSRFFGRDWKLFPTCPTSEKPLPLHSWGHLSTTPILNALHLQGPRSNIYVHFHWVNK